MMMNKNSIGMRLTLAFGLTTAILVITVGIAFKGFRSLQMALEAVKQQSIQIVAAKDTYGQAMATLSYVAAAASASELALGQHYAELAQSHHDAYQAELETLKGTVHTEESKQVLDALEAAPAGISEAAAWQLIDFLHPNGRFPEYHNRGGERPWRRVQVQGSVSLCELRSRVMTSRFGYYGDEPVSLHLDNYLPGR